MMDAAGRHPRAGQAVLELRPAAADAPAQLRRVELYLAHALRTAREHELGGAGLNLHAAVEHGLKRRAATPVDLDPRNVHRQARIERGHTADRGSLPVRVALAH